MNFRIKSLVTLISAVSFSTQLLAATDPKPATEFTKKANAELLTELPFNDKQDFIDAHRGFIAKPDTLIIKDNKGNVVWDLESYKKFISADVPAPDTVNPSLWRNAQLNMEYGLFQVTDHIYQVRGFDISNMTFIQGKTGWIVIDTLLSAETAKAALDFVNEKLGKRPVVAVIYSHSHADHYGGIRGIVTDAEVQSGKVQIFAPENFAEHAVSENVTVGNAMSRRAIYMYGAFLPRNAQGSVNGGLGQTLSSGKSGVIMPTQEIKKTGEKITLDGVEMVFQLTPGTEAPAEMNTWFPQEKALWMAENTTNTMHNIVTLRGAQVRDADLWADNLNKTVALWGDQVQVKFQSHHWPRWGNANIIDYFKKQRDLYKYTHDQTVRMLNNGMTGEEIAETIKLPDELNTYWPDRGYYGTLRHNSRAVYQKYLGWYDGKPANLNNLPPELLGKKYVEFMGGEDAVVKKAKTSYDNGEYRWVATVMTNVVFANPQNTEAKELLADAYEQLGYQAESGSWRAVYLQGAFELRNGIPTGGGMSTASPDTIRAMTPEMLFGYLGVRLIPEKVAGKNYSINVNFTDLGANYTLTVENSVLNYMKNRGNNANVNVTLTKPELAAIQMQNTTLDQSIADGKITVTGDKKVLNDFLASLENADFWFPIVTP